MFFLIFFTGPTYRKSNSGANPRGPPPKKLVLCIDQNEIKYLVKRKIKIYILRELHLSVTCFARQFYINLN